MEPQMASQIKENLKKTRLGTRSTKHVENVLNLMPSDLRKTCFRMERLQKSLKPEVRTSMKKYQKMCRNEANIHEKSVPELNKKRCLKTDAKNQKISKRDPQIGPKR